MMASGINIQDEFNNQRIINELQYNSNFGVNNRTSSEMRNLFSEFQTLYESRILKLEEMENQNEIEDSKSVRFLC